MHVLPPPPPPPIEPLMLTGESTSTDTSSTQNPKNKRTGENKSQYRRLIEQKFEELENKNWLENKKIIDRQQETIDLLQAQLGVLYQDNMHLHQRLNLLCQAQNASAANTYELRNHYHVKDNTC